MKKILILNWRDPKHPHAGGAEQATLIHAEAWRDAGYDVTWFSSSVDGIADFEIVDGIKFIRKGYFVFGVQFAAFIHLAKNKYDLVVDQIHGLPFFTPIYLWNTPKLAYIHEVAKEVVWHNPYPFPLNKFVGFVASVFEPLVFRIFYSNVPFMTVSNSTKKELEAWGVKNVEVIHNGVTIPKGIKKIPKNNEKTLLYLGALAKDKGVEDAVDVFNKLSRKHNDWKFWIAGRGSPDYVSELKKIAVPKVKFFGYVTDKKKFELLSKSHLLVNPSIREGWGLVNIEANAMGTPVVGYKVAGMIDSVKNNDTGLLVTKYDKTKLIRIIEELLSNDRYDTFVQNCERWSKNYSWTKSVKESTELVNKYARENPTHPERTVRIRSKDRKKYLSRD